MDIEQIIRDIVREELANLDELVQSSVRNVLVEYGVVPQGNPVTTKKGEYAMSETSTLDQFPEILTVNQIAEYLGCNDDTVYRLCSSGELPSFKSGHLRRIRKQTFIDWIRQQENSPS